MPDQIASSINGPDTERTDVSEILVRSVELGIVLADPQRQLLAFNESAARLTGLSPAVVNQSIDILPAPLREIIDRTLTGKSAPGRRTIILNPHSPQRTVLSVNTSMLQVCPGQAESVLTVLQDLVAAQDLERSTGRLQRLASVGTLSAGVAHEIKNALVAIKSFADVLLEKGQDVEMANLVSREAGRIDSLVSQLLRFAGPAKAAFAGVKLHEAMGNCLRLVQHPLKTRRIDLQVHLDAGADEILGDAKQLEQAFLNLLLNAIEAMDAGGQLVVRSELVLATEHYSKFEPNKKHEQIQISIRDTGPGIPPEIRASLFKPFVTGKASGTGLGLAITHRIITEHRGRISVESARGKGTTFHIVLPLNHA